MHQEPIDDLEASVDDSLSCLRSLTQVRAGGSAHLLEPFGQCSFTLAKHQRPTLGASPPSHNRPWTSSLSCGLRNVRLVRRASFTPASNSRSLTTRQTSGRLRQLAWVKPSLTQINKSHSSNQHNSPAAATAAAAAAAPHVRSSAGRQWQPQRRLSGTGVNCKTLIWQPSSSCSSGWCSSPPTPCRVVRATAPGPMLAGWVMHTLMYCRKCCRHHPRSSRQRTVCCRRTKTAAAAAAAAARRSCCGFTTVQALTSALLHWSAAALQQCSAGGGPCLTLQLLRLPVRNRTQRARGCCRTHGEPCLVPAWWCQAAAAACPA